MNKQSAMQTVRSGRPSAISQALRAIENDVGAGQARYWPIPGYRILVAADRATRERAYALAYRVYKASGYVLPSAESQALCVSPFDGSAQTLTLLAQDEDGNDCATVSLVFDGAQGLPCDEIYAREAEALRAGGCRLAEVTRLAMAEECAGAKELLLHLFNQCYVFARIVNGASDLLIEVNPRHCGYYKRLLRFSEAGPERACARVQGAPAVLLRLNFDRIEAIFETNGRSSGRDLRGRRLYRYAYSRSDESVIADFLAREHRPMSSEDAFYFRIPRVERRSKEYAL